jgi:glucose uptake protein GlcU
VVVTSLFQNWRVVLAYLLGIVAVALLVVNVRELRR